MDYPSRLPIKVLWSLLAVAHVLARMIFLSIYYFPRLARPDSQWTYRQALSKRVVTLGKSISYGEARKEDDMILVCASFTLPLNIVAPKTRAEDGNSGGDVIKRYPYTVGWQRVLAQMWPPANLTSVIS